MPLIHIESIEGGIHGVTLCDPDSHNSLSPRMMHELVETLHALCGRTDVRVVVLFGGQRVFSSGASLHSLVEQNAQLSFENYWSWVDELTGFPVPVVGALEGDAVGGGLALALLGCDVIVAAEGRRYGLNFTELGFTPGMGMTQVLPALVGYRTAFEMLATARFYRGAELRDKGVFNEVVPAVQVRRRALDLARQIDSKPRHVLLMLKEALSSGRRRGLQEAVQREYEMQVASFSEPGTRRRIEETFHR